ncbi:DExH-box ATP-dependent RNA helicase DExH15 chloroplastic isoform X1 [Canna indica]|uniref:DExH-box ATP-dependent RNA helicase DExH15 chloroplastic isoform X1 n=1 Tax=Canna indica TaxID=4628 RepID=A0AAQ3KG08_9LILI|nr:DExH-box ATP-dependent RNA helicase DExH15 chloroplastic isoform X1 [Canna indica]
MRSFAPPSRCSASPAHLFRPSHPPTYGSSFRLLRFLGTSSAFSPGARAPLVPLRANPLRSTSPIKEPLSDADEDEEYDDDEEVAATEYDDGILDAFDEEEEEDSEAEIGLPEAEARPSTKLKEPMWERVAKLLAEARDFGEEIIDYEELAGTYDFPIDKFQQLAIQAFLRGSSVVVSAPTSSGKTLIAEAAAIATVARGRRLFYTTPLKALSNQKFRDFRSTFGDTYVGLLTGDSAINKEAPILIMTTEILRNMLYQSVGMNSSASRLFHVDVIVLDEVHYLSDISRGTVWEEIVIYSPKEVQLICLSATVANPDELAGWIGQVHGKTELVTSTKRPVPLTWHFSLKNSLLPLLDEKGKRINRKLSLDYMQTSLSRGEFSSENKTMKPRMGKADRGNRSVARMSRQAPLSKNDMNHIRRSQVPQIRDTLWQLMERDMLPAIWFIFSRRGCDAAVQYLEDCHLLDECEAGEVELEYRRFRKQYPDAVREVAVKGLLHGIAAHHAGCLPLWKSFIEELFQRGLVKVVFATETLAAGINMPARTAIIASLSRKSESGRSFLSTNELFQMAGRAGRRGIDEVGHVVFIQTPYEGANECYELLSAGLEPLVSQFTASYGMVLNLLAGTKITGKFNYPDSTKLPHCGRTLEEARKLVEQSFGNYVGSNVMLAAQEELEKIRHEIELLSLEITEDAIDRKCQEQLSEIDYAEISRLQEQLRAEKRTRTELRQQMEIKRMAAWRPLLEEFGSENLPFICLQYKDKEAVQHNVPAVYIGKLSSSSVERIVNMVKLDSSDFDNMETDCRDMKSHEDGKPAYHLALSSDNTWYLFTEKWIKTMYRTGLPNISSVNGDPLPREMLMNLLMKENHEWEKIADSEFGSLLCMDGSLETWSWSLNVPVLSSLSEEDEVANQSGEYHEIVGHYKEQRRKVSQLKKKITNTKGFKEFKKIIDATKFTKERIERLNSRSNRLSKRIAQIEPTGWKEFLQISKVIQETRALDLNTQVIFPLGETAAAIRGENELWLAMVLRSKVLLDLKPAELAAVCGSLVSEGIKVRPWKSNNYIYEPSSNVIDVIYLLEEQRSSLIQIQDKYSVKIPCGLDGQFSGMVEAWASGLTWREIMMDCAMDDGDLARLLRRTIDLLSQIPKLPDIDPLLQKNALLAYNVMDRSPISELAG